MFFYSFEYFTAIAAAVIIPLSVMVLNDLGHFLTEQILTSAFVQIEIPC
jgi:hypothetical protein